MGFDLHGIDTKLTEKKGLYKKLQNKDGYTDWNKVDKLSKKKKEQYWKEKDEWEKENPGNYFRNNVWWWRPLWAFVCDHCSDILTEEDAEHGCYNEGHVIDADAAMDIYIRLSELKRDGTIISHCAEYMNKLESEPDEECRLCNGTGKRKDMKVENGCNGCHGKGTKRPWSNSYPFSPENVYEFMEFCKYSGGFEIC